MKVDAILLAGARNQGALKECSPLEYEALIEIKGVPMINYVFDAVRDAQSVEKIVVVGPVAALTSHLEGKDTHIIESSNHIVDNIIRGLKVVGRGRKVLIITSDIPMINSETIDQFVAKCAGLDVDFYYPIISKQANLAKFPDTKRTYARLREGTYTGGNMVIINPEVIEQAKELISKVVTYRKKPFKLSQLFGLKFIVKFILGKLTISELEDRLKKITGISAVTLICELPEIGFDIDKPSDLEMVKSMLND